jgi:hypothetical protein
MLLTVYAFSGSDSLPKHRVSEQHMRVVAAAVSIFALMLGLAGAASYLNLFRYPVVAGIGIAVLTILGCIAALALFNKKALQGVPFEEQIRALESQGLLTSEDFVALRAFEVEEMEDEGMHFYVELQDKRVLFLSGQYLYDYEPTADSGTGRARRFPCSEFILRRHRVENYVADLVCKGKAFDPEFVAPPFSEKELYAGQVPSNGDIIADITYDELKRQRRGAAG